MVSHVLLLLFITLCFVFLWRQRQSNSRCVFITSAQNSVIKKPRLTNHWIVWLPPREKRPAASLCCCCHSQTIVNWTQMFDMETNGNEQQKQIDNDTSFISHIVSHYVIIHVTVMWLVFLLWWREQRQLIFCEVFHFVQFIVFFPSFRSIVRFVRWFGSSFLFLQFLFKFIFAFFTLCSHVMSCVDYLITQSLRTRRLDNRMLQPIHSFVAFTALKPL